MISHSSPSSHCGHATFHQAPCLQQFSLFLECSAPSSWLGWIHLTFCLQLTIMSPGRLWITTLSESLTFPLSPNYFLVIFLDSPHNWNYFVCLFIECLSQQEGQHMMLGVLSIFFTTFLQCLVYFSVPGRHSGRTLVEWMNRLSFVLCWCNTSCSSQMSCITWQDSDTGGCMGH